MSDYAEGLKNAIADLEKKPVTTKKRMMKKFLLLQLEELERRNNTITIGETK